jgi:5-methylcytosine-specific restriction protein A
MGMRTATGLTAFSNTSAKARLGTCGFALAIERLQSIQQKEKCSLLLRRTSEGLRFEGEMVCEGYHLERARDRKSAERDAIVFELRSLEAVAEKVEAEPAAPPGLAMEDLRRLAFNAAAEPSRAPSQGMRNVYQRSRDIRVYVLARANGKCEGCSAPAPFLRSDGTPYLEPHYLRRLSNGGPDHPAHVIALCPNCHRRVHAGADGDAYNAKLDASMPWIEP